MTTHLTMPHVLRSAESPGPVHATGSRPSASSRQEVRRQIVDSSRPVQPLRARTRLGAFHRRNRLASSVLTRTVLLTCGQMLLLSVAPPALAGEIVGRTTADVEDHGYCDGEQYRILPHAQVRLSGGETGFSDDQGEFNLPYDGSDPVVVTTGLDGRWVEITNLLGDDPTLSGIATPGIPLELRWTDEHAPDEERDAYLHVNRIHDAVKACDPQWSPPDHPMPVTINAPFTCGASWNGTGILLGRAGNGCANIARLGDAIYHEYAHALTEWIYGSHPVDVATGAADVAAAFLGNDPIIAEGFFLGDCDRGLRDLREVKRWPEDYVPGQPFESGLIISGFWWDVREALIASLGSEDGAATAWRLWHLSRRHFLPLTMPEQVLAAFLQDDDDGDLGNGTPHYGEICQAAIRHGFECPAGIGASPLPTRANPPAARKVPVVRCAPNPASGLVRISHEVEPGVAVLEVSVCDAAGRRLRRLEGGWTGPGHYSATWDLAGADSEPVPAGVYSIIMRTDRYTSSSRVAVLR